MKISIKAPCAEWAEKLAARHPNDLLPAEAVALRQHLQSCSACTTAFTAYTLMETSIRELPPAEPLASPPSEFIQQRVGRVEADRCPVTKQKRLAFPLGLPQRSRTLSTPRWPRVVRLANMIASVVIVGAIIISSVLIFTNHHVTTVAATPTASHVNPTAPTTPPSVPTATPTVPAPAPIGLAPQDCPAGPTPENIDSSFAPAIGAAPAWAVGFTGPHATLLFGDKHTMYSWVQNDGHGWSHKLLWVVGPNYSGVVTIHGANLRDGTPLWMGAEEKGGVTTTSLVLNPNDPTVVNRPGNWVEFPGGLDIPKAGCYYLEANWPGGSWRITFAAGV